jgi:hypothetical protein
MYKPVFRCGGYSLSEITRVLGSSIFTCISIRNVDRIPDMGTSQMAIDSKRALKEASF